MVKNLPAKAGDTGDSGSISRLGRSPGKEMATHSSILASIFSWTEVLGSRATVRGVAESAVTEHRHMYVNIYVVGISYMC